MKKKGIVYIFFAIIFIPGIMACIKNSQIDLIPIFGKIGYGKSTPNSSIKFHILSQSGRSHFMLEAQDDIYYSINSWMNKEDLLCGYQTFYDDKKNQDLEVVRFKEVKIRPQRTDIILIDTLGKLRETLYQGDEMIEIGFVFPSPSDNKLFFTTNQLPPKVNDFLDLGSIPISFNIYDLNKKKFIIQIKDVVPGISFLIRENPWSKDEKKIVYGITGRRIERQTLEGEKIVYGAERERIGVYICDLITGESKRISKEGFGPVWSPDGKYIAYIKGKNTVWLYDVEKETHEEYLTLREYDNMGVLRWSPDGTYLLIGFVRENPLTIDSSHSYLIRFKDKKWFQFKENFPGHFTWKK